MGASYVAIGDHDLTLEEILCLPIRLAPLAFSSEQHRAAVNVVLEPVASPPPPLREAELWIVEGVNGCSSVVFGMRSFTVHTYGPKVWGFLLDAQARAEMRRLSRAVAEVVGARRLVYCTDYGSSWEWDAVERGEQVQDVIAYLTGDRQQRLAGWDETWSEDEYWRHDFEPPFFLDEWT